MIGVELVKNKVTKEPLDMDTMMTIVGKLIGNGVVMVPCGRYNTVLRFMPPLVITKKHIDKASDILLKVVREVGGTA